MSWGQTQLGNLISISKGKKHTFVINGTHRYINIEDLHRDNNPQFTNDNGVWCNPNDLIIAWDGANAGKVGVGYEGVIGSTLARLLIKNKDVNARFLYWFLESKNEIIKAQRTGATIPHINGSSLRDLQVPLPPLPIQKRIAEILDAADALKRKDQQLLKKYDDLAQAIFIDMFGDPVKNEKGWEVKRIDDVTYNFDSYRKPVKSSDREQIQGIYPYYGATGIIDFVNEYLLDGQFLLISEDGKNLVGRYKKIAFLAEGKIWVNNHAHVLQGKDNCNNYYLEYFLNKIDLTPYVTGIDQYKLNRSNLDIIPILIPPIDLQNKFESLIKDVGKQLLQATKQQLLAINLFDKLIQKAFSGELIN